jgi:hypothetical protein
MLQRRRAYWQNMTNTHSAKRTQDHDEIRTWVEERGGRPSVVESTWDGESGLLRIDFGEKEEELSEISWDDFFRVFDENNLVFLYQDQTADGSESRFFKFVEASKGEGDEE